MILLILALVWAAVLGPGILRRRAERRAGDSIGAFHRQLRILQRTGPMVVAPAHSLRSRPFSLDRSGGSGVPGGPAAADGSVVTGERSGGSGEPLLPPRSGLTLVSPSGARRPFVAAASHPDRPSLRAVRTRRPDPYFRPEACRNRRNLLLGILVTFGASGLLGLIPPLGALLVITYISGIALVGYVGLLVYMRSVAQDRQTKLRYIPAWSDDELADDAFDADGEQRVAVR